MKKFKYWIMSLLAAAVLVCYAPCCLATEDPSLPETESSIAEETSVPEESIPQEPSVSEPESLPESSPEPSEDSSQPQSSDEASEESPMESSQPSEPSVEPEPSTPSEPSVESVPEEEPEPSYEPEPSFDPDTSDAPEIADPYGAIAGVGTLLPADRRDSSRPPKENSQTSSLESSTPTVPGTERSRTPSSKPAGLLTTPPTPDNELPDSIPGSTAADTNAVLMGIIFWSVIGVIVTTVLIMLLNFNGGNPTSNMTFARKRYRSESKKDPLQDHTSLTSISRIVR